MNANELADAIQYCGDGGYNLDAATMLRQQHSEIEALKKQLAFMEDDYPEPTIMAKMMEVDLVRQQQAEIEALKDLTIVMQIELDYLRDKAQEK